MSYSAYIFFFFHLIEYPTIAKLYSYDSISSYKNESSRIYRYINTINIILVHHSGVPFRNTVVEVSYIEGNDSYRSYSVYSGKSRVEREGGGGRERGREGRVVVVEKDETVRNVARSTLPFPRLNIAIQLFDPVLRLPSGGNLLLPPPPPPPPPSSSEEESRL